MTTPMPHLHAGSTRNADPAMIMSNIGTPNRSARRSFASAVPSRNLSGDLFDGHREPAESFDR